jgi:hypothetical protein
MRSIDAVDIPKVYLPRSAGYNRGMDPFYCSGALSAERAPELSAPQAALLVGAGAAYAACGIWLAVRIINRRERRARWAALGLFVLAMYPASFGPACWITSRTDVGAAALPTIYRPMVALMQRSSRAFHTLNSYCQFGAPPVWSWSDGGDGSWTSFADTPP